MCHARSASARNGRKTLHERGEPLGTGTARGGETDQLRDERGITRADSVYCRGVSILREARAPRGRLPEPSLARLVTVVADAEEADALFEFIHERAGVGRSGGGTIFMTRLIMATSMRLPQGAPTESDGRNGSGAR